MSSNVDVRAQIVNILNDVGDSLTLRLTSTDVVLVASDVQAVVGTDPETLMASEQDGDDVLLTMTKEQTADMGDGVWTWYVVYDSGNTTIAKGNFILEVR